MNCPQYIQHPPSADWLLFATRLRALEGAASGEDVGNVRQMCARGAGPTPAEESRR